MYRDDYETPKTWKRLKPKPLIPEAPSLWDAPAPSVPRPTSEKAADKQGTHKRAIDRQVILQTLAYSPMIRDEIARLTGISPNTVRPRIVELITLGHVRDDRAVGRTATGSEAAVCEATEAGLHWLASVEEG